MTNKINIFKPFLFIAALLFSVNSVFAGEPNDEPVSDSVAVQHPAEKKGGFDAGKTIIEHVSDSHSWHLFGHYAIPLPVILKTDKGLEVFSSSRFGHEGEEKVAGKYYTYKLEEGKVLSKQSRRQSSFYCLDFNLVLRMPLAFVVLLFY